MSAVALAELEALLDRLERGTERLDEPAALRTASDRASAVAVRLAQLATVHEGTRAPTAGPSTVLVADDDEQIRHLLSRMLANAGFAVTLAESGDAALAALATARFDVILSDVQMPDGTGLDLLRGVRRFDLDVPVLLVSGAPDVATAAAAIEYGAFRYLTKPLQAGPLVALVGQAARAHALARLRRDAFAASGAQALVADRAGLEVRFEAAMTDLWLAFQPIFDARSGALYGVEGLVRTSEPSLAKPPVLVDAAVQLGRLSQLGRRVRAMGAAAVQALASAPELAVFVNLHPDDLLDDELVSPDSPLAALASRVVLEVTERSALHATPALAARVVELRALGFRIAVDDIGAGYSGLASFTALTPEIVKLDLSLVRDVHRAPFKQRTVAALCNLCHEVGCLVLGEGVETAAERDCLVSLGCDLLQGFLLGRPDRDLPATA